MHGRTTSLSRTSSFVVLLAVLFTAGNAHAHRLDAQVFLLPNRMIQVESWFSNGDAAKDAKVQVFGAQGQLLTEGQLNDQGVFVFPPGHGDPVRVVISAGAGHRKELTIAASALARAAASTATGDDSAMRANQASLPVPLTERDSGVPIKDALIGISFLLAVAAFVLSLRNARKLRTVARPEKAND